MKDRTPIYVVAIAVASFVVLGYTQWYRFRWLHDAELVRGEGVMGRQVCEDYCSAAGGIVTEVRAAFAEGGAHLMPECVCLVDVGVDPE